AEINKKKSKLKVKRFFRYFLFTVGSVLSAVVVSFLILLYGPFTQLRDLYAITMLETSAAKFMATAFLSEKTIAEIYERNQTLASDEKTDPSLIQIAVTTKPQETDTSEPGATVNQPGNLLPENQQTDVQQTTAPNGEDVPQTEPALTADMMFANHPDAMPQTDGIEGIQLVGVSGPTYSGYMLIISDPSRVSLCVSESIISNAAGGGSWWNYSRGQQLSTMVKNTGAIAAINGGAFYDPDGEGNGGCPDGVLCYNGDLMYWGPEANGLYDWENVKVNVIGISYDNILILGQYTKSEFQSLNIRDAVSFDNPDPPFLVMNGKQSEVVGTGGSGIQPRTCIGQRADGAFLFLVIDGRGAGGSLGATQKEATQVLLAFGAVNAANLDGGSSSEMIINGETVSKPCSLIGARYMPDGFIVR
ncbi:MAG: phosphodiester glycosidase family protein, partial [Clostridia bacterium]|nr:phosphodiester glycosidase family protein [Clostridia bacterium]